MVLELLIYAKSAIKKFRPIRGLHCTVKHHMDIINFACMMWNFVRISATLSALSTNIDRFVIGIAFLKKIYPISVAQKL